MSIQNTPVEPEISRFDLGRDQTPRLVLRPRVLLAESDSEVRHVIRWALLRDGCDVIESRDDHELFDYLTTSLAFRHVFPAPDLVVADVDMPVMNGVDAILRLRDLLRRTPLVVISGHIDDRMREVADRLHLAGLFGKPVDLEALRTVVKCSVAV